MGITGLLPFLEQASRSCHISEFRGATVAVDTYCWLHKGAFGCAEKLIVGEETTAYVQYCLKYVRMLKSYDVTPIMVFDGKHLPAKKFTEEERREKRRAAKQKAAELLRLGRVDEARSQMRLAIDVTHEMASAVIKECRKMGVDCIVAPFEADAQLAFLHMKKFVHLVITEDSDLLLFGCTRIFVKMDFQGSGTLVDAKKINDCMKLRYSSYSFNKFRYMCILSGCDYLANLPGIGLKKGLKFVSMTANPNIYDVLSKLPSYLKLPNLVVTEKYKRAFMIADATFQHQIVYDPIKRKLRPLTSPEDAGTKPEYCVNAGYFFHEAQAYQMALGNIDPLNDVPCDSWCPVRARVPPTSIWSADYQKALPLPRQQPKLAAPPTQNVQVNLQMTQENQASFDLKLEKELQMYKVITQVSRKRTIKVDVERDGAQPGTSSETVYIPFKRIKNLSKFQSTLYEARRTTTSAFFAKKSAQSSPIIIEEDDYVESTLTPTIDSSECPTSTNSELDPDVEIIGSNSDRSSQEYESRNRFAKFATTRKDAIGKEVPIITIESDSEERSPEQQQEACNSCDSQSAEENNNLRSELLKKQEVSDEDPNADGNVSDDSLEGDNARDIDYSPNSDGNSSGAIQKGESSPQEDQDYMSEISSIHGDGAKGCRDTEAETEQSGSPESMPKLCKISEDFDEQGGDAVSARQGFSSDDDGELQGNYPDFYDDNKQDQQQPVVYPYELPPEALMAKRDTTGFYSDGNGSSSSEEAAMDITNDRLRKYYAKTSPVMTRSRRVILSAIDGNRRQRQLSLPTMLKKMSQE